MTGQELAETKTETTLPDQPSPDHWRAPAWLSNWTIDQPVPVPLADVERAIIATEAVMEPVDGDRLGSGLARLLNVCCPPSDSPRYPETQKRLREWWIGTDQEPGAKPVYVAALKDLPLDLLQKACIEVVKAHRAHYKMPSVADLRHHVADDLAARNTALLRLRMARDMSRTAKHESKPRSCLDELTPDQRARHAEIMARLDKLPGRAVMDAA